MCWQVYLVCNLCCQEQSAFYDCVISAVTSGTCALCKNVFVHKYSKHCLLRADVYQQMEKHEKVKLLLSYKVQYTHIFKKHNRFGSHWQKIKYREVCLKTHNKYI